MEEVAEGVARFLSTKRGRLLPATASTRAVVAALRAHLDDAVPGWRERAFADGAPAGGVIEVEVHLRGGRVARGALAQRPSEVRGEAA